MVINAPRGLPTTPIVTDKGPISSPDNTHRIPSEKWYPRASQLGFKRTIPVSFLRENSFQSFFILKQFAFSLTKFNIFAYNLNIRSWNPVLKSETLVLTIHRGQ